MYSQIKFLDSALPVCSVTTGRCKNISNRSASVFLPEDGVTGNQGIGPFLYD